MSSSDVRDILSLPERQGGGRNANAGRARAPPALPGDARPKTRPDGMTRELYALLGPNAPSLVMGSGGGAESGSTGAFQPKFVRKSGTARARKWTWAPFRNPSRQDTPSEAQMAAAGSLPDDESGVTAGRAPGLVLYHWKADDAPDGGANADETELDATWAPFNTASQVFHYSADEYEQHLKGGCARA